MAVRDSQSYWSHMRTHSQHKQQQDSGVGGGGGGGGGGEKFPMMRQNTNLSIWSMHQVSRNHLGLNTIRINNE